MSKIKLGECVEFTAEWQFDYTLGDPEKALFGIAIEEETSQGVKVRMEDGSERMVPSECVAWAGWSAVSEKLEAIQEEVDPTPWEDGYCGW